MKGTIIILLLFLAGSLSAQELVEQRFHDNGKLKSTLYKQGPVMYFVTYHESGKLAEKGQFNNGKRDGIWKRFAENGTLLAEASFRNGQRHGEWRFWTDDVRMTGRAHFDNGTLTRGEQWNKMGELVATAGL